MQIGSMSYGRRRRRRAAGVGEEQAAGCRGSRFKLFGFAIYSEKQNPEIRLTATPAPSSAMMVALGARVRHHHRSSTEKARKRVRVVITKSFELVQNSRQSTCHDPPFAPRPYSTALTDFLSALIPRLSTNTLAASPQPASPGPPESTSMEPASPGRGSAPTQTHSGAALLRRSSGWKTSRRP